MTGQPDSGGLGYVDHEFSLAHVVDLFLGGDDLELADLLGVVEHLHVQGPKAGGGEPFAQDSKVLAHEDLVDTVAGKEVRGGQLDVQPGVGQGDGQVVVSHVRNEVVGVEER